MSLIQMLRLELMYRTRYVNCRSQEYILTRQTSTHHMVKGQTAQEKQIPEFSTGLNLRPPNPPSHQHQNLSTQVSKDNSSPMVE